MSDFNSFGGSDEENDQIKRLNAEVVCRNLSSSSRSSFLSLRFAKATSLFLLTIHDLPLGLGGRSR
jgi:hypothetical protein